MKPRLMIGMVLLVLLAPSRAFADWFVTPFAGVTFGGDASKNKLSMGASLTGMGAGIAGVEFELGYTPDFFNENADTTLISGSNVTTLMASLIVGAPVGGQHGAGVRPYASAGLGLLRSRVTSGSALFDNVSANDLGVSAGAGVIGFVSDHVGLRGDLRYFRSLQDASPDPGLVLEIGKFHFWRATAGVALRF